MPKEVYVIDLFCGCGGFSTGARQAGAKVILAVYCWKEALAVHEANHPDTEHLCEALGGDLDEFVSFLTGFIDLNVPQGGHVHLHASPPCQNLSSGNPIRDEKQGLMLVEWTLLLISNLEDAIDTWSIEQVRNPIILAFLKYHPGKVFPLEEYGIPQLRRRLFIGNIAWDKLDAYKSNSMTLGEVMTKCGHTAPHGMTTMTNHTIIRNNRGMAIKHDSGRNMLTHRPIDTVSLTVCYSSPLLYNKVTGELQILPLSVFCELQTFPLDYIFGSSRTLARKMISNALPPLFASIICSSVMQDM